MRTTTTTAQILLAGPEDSIQRLVDLLSGQAQSLTAVLSPGAAHRRLRDEPETDVVILVPGADLGDYTEFCRTIKFDERTRFVAVVFLLSRDHADRAAEVFEAGADDCIRTSATDREILLRLAKTIRVKRDTDSLEDSGAVLTALAAAVEGKDHYTCGHVERVGAYCVEIGRRAGVDEEGLLALKTGGVVHDIGKIGIPDQVLNKPGKLTDDEMEIIRRHPVIGYDILKPLRTFRQVLPIVRWHHERPNGTGYPDGLKGDELPLLPRITSVADCFDALTTDRPYRKAFSLEQTREILSQSAAKGELDADLVAVLFEILQQGGMGLAA